MSKLIEITMRFLKREIKTKISWVTELSLKKLFCFGMSREMFFGRPIPSKSQTSLLTSIYTRASVPTQVMYALADSELFTCCASIWSELSQDVTWQPVAANLDLSVE